MNTSQYLKAYNSQIKVGDYVFTYVGNRDAYSIICVVTSINNTKYILRNVDTNRVIVRHWSNIVLLPNFENLKDQMPEAFI